MREQSIGVPCCMSVACGGLASDYRRQVYLAPPDLCMVVRRPESCFPNLVSYEISVVAALPGCAANYLTQRLNQCCLALLCAAPLNMRLEADFPLLLR